MRLLIDVLLEGTGGGVLFIMLSLVLEQLDANVASSGLDRR